MGWISELPFSTMGRYARAGSSAVGCRGPACAWPAASKPVAMNVRQRKVIALIDFVLFMVVVDELRWCAKVLVEERPSWLCEKGKSPEQNFCLLFLDRHSTRPLSVLA